MKFIVLLVLMIVAIVESSLANAQSPEPKRVVFAADQVDTRAEPKKRIRIRWPSGIKKGDSITLRFIVTAEGEKEEFTVVKFTNPDMVGAAAEAYEKAVYAPASKGGKKVASWIAVTEIVR